VSDRIIRIGCASGFWGDSATGAPQLARVDGMGYLVFDYLAELTMSLLVRARRKDPALGYATDFVSGALRTILPDLAARGIKVVANAGGVNPQACAAAVAALCAEAGHALRIAVVEGDDVLPLIPALRAAGTAEMFTGAPLPPALLSANAYLGAKPIAAALAGGADIVITGRNADSALTLGILIHEFGWSMRDWDRLAAGSLAGHILECGAQATGGIFTDWQTVEGWDRIGYPIAECRADGSFVVTKPPGTGGLVSVGTIAEQLLYELGDPASYVLPDVVADFRTVRLTQIAPDRVEVSGARGRPATPTYKVSATYADGWRGIASLTLVGPGAARKTERTAEAILTRTRAMLRDRGLEDYRATELELLGTEAIYGPRAGATGTREVVMRLGVEHRDKAAIELFAREIASAGTSFAPGTTGYGGGRPKAVQVVRLFSMLVDKALLPPPTLGLDGVVHPVPIEDVGEPLAAVLALAAEEGQVPEGATVDLPLGRLAWARSGDKGDIGNIGVIARRPELMPLLRRALTPERMAAHFAHLLDGPVTRYELPGLGAFNFVLERVLGGGGMASLRNDPQGKALAQMALEMLIPTPVAWAGDGPDEPPA